MPRARTEKAAHLGEAFGSGMLTGGLRNFPVLSEADASASYAESSRAWLGPDLQQYTMIVLAFKLAFKWSRVVLLAHYFLLFHAGVV